MDGDSLRIGTVIEPGGLGDSSDRFLWRAAHNGYPIMTLDIPLDVNIGMYPCKGIDCDARLSAAEGELPDYLWARDNGHFDLRAVLDSRREFRSDSDGVAYADWRPSKPGSCVVVPSFCLPAEAEAGIGRPDAVVCEIVLRRKP
jgi:hypothetical protein